MNNPIKICFEVTGVCEQEVIVTATDVSSEELVKGLNEGIYLTTLEVVSESLGPSTRTIIEFDETGNEVTIGVILSQTLTDSTEYTNFELLPD